MPRNLVDFYFILIYTFILTCLFRNVIKLVFLTLRESLLTVINLLTFRESLLTLNHVDIFNSSMLIDSTNLYKFEFDNKIFVSSANNKVNKLCETY